MAMRQQDSELDGVISGRTAIAGIVAFGLIAVSTLVLFLVRSDAATEVRGNPGTTWLSGEAEGRLVMAAAGGARPSVAVEIGTQGDAYDVVDLGHNVLAHDRTTGAITVLDAVTGLVEATVEASPPADDRAALVAAGDVAYLVDQASGSVVKVSADGAVGEATKVEQGFTDWVGTSDGRLWLLNRTDGSYSTVKDTNVDRRSLAEPGADLVLSAVGNDPIVLDRDNSRLRWLRRNQTVEIPADAAAILQQPDPAGSCAHVIAAGRLACFGPDGPLREMPVSMPDAEPAGAWLFANRYNAVVTWPGQSKIVLADWRSARSAEAEHPEPSSRSLVGWSTVGPLLVDDPGSRYAFTVDRGKVVQLDKFSRQTVLLSADGQSLNGDGASELDEEAEIEGVVTEPIENVDVVPNDDGRNDPPQAFPDQAVTRSGRDVIVPVLANDVDPDGDPLLVTSAGPLGAGSGEVTILGGIEVLYSPPDDFTGEAIFNYTIADPDGLTSSAAVTVTVIDNETNDPPTATDDTAKTQAGTSVDIDVLRNDTDPQGDPLTITKIETPANGTVAPVGAGRVRYTPNANFTGSDFFGYTIDDGFGGEATAVVRVEVVAAATSSRPPEAVDDRASTAAGKLVSIEVLANDTDPDGDPLRVTAFDTVSGVELAIIDSRVITALPDQNMSGLVTFNYTVEDTNGLRDTARVALNIEPAQANRPPKAVADKATSASIAIPLDLVANDVDPDGDPLLIINVTDPPPSAGSVVKTGPRTVQFTPVQGFIGTTSFTYTVTDPLGETSTATVTVAVIPPLGSGPVARDDAVSVFAGDTVTISPLANDSHPDGLPFGLAGPPVVREGQATLGANNTIQYTPPPIGSGPYVLTYTIKDTYTRTATASITVTVVARPPVNKAPVAIDDVASTTFSTTLVIDVMQNDLDPENKPLKLDSVSQPTTGTGETSIVNGQIRYVPPASFDGGIASFTYTIADSEGLKSTATVLVQVAPRVRIAPIARPDFVPVLLTGATINIRPADNDEDPDGPNSELRIVAGSLGTSPGLTVSLGQAGRTVTLTAGGQPATHTIPYTIVDVDGRTASSTITIIVDYPYNNPPTARDDSFTVFPNQPLLLPVLANDTDAEGGALTLVSVGPTSNGGTAVKDGNQVRFTSDGSITGSTSFSYVVSDAGPPSKQSTATVTVTLAPCQQPVPQLSNKSMTTRYQTALSANVFGAGDIRDGTLTISQPAPGTGTVVPGSGGAFVYTPPAGFNDNATFSYEVRNICGASATATVTIDVNRRPSAGAVTTSTAKNTSVLVAPAATDPDGDPLTPVVAGSGSGGTAVVEGSGFRFTPTPGFTGQATFQYYVVDIGGLESGAATVTVNVANAPPVAGNFTVSMFNTDPVKSINVLVPPTADPDGDPLTLRSRVDVVPESAGVAVGAGDSVIFTPTGSLTPNTAITLTYRITDGESPNVLGTVTILVQNRPPSAGTDSSSGPGPIAVNVLVNDADPDGDLLTVTGAAVESVTRVIPDPPPSTTGSADPMVNVAFDQSTVTYSVGDPTFTGTIVIAYTISDGRGGTATGKINITIS